MATEVVSGSRRGNGSGKGRAKGTPNKTTRELKETVLLALSNLGGASYLETVGREKPEVFCQLLARILPTDVNARVSGGPVLRIGGTLILPPGLGGDRKIIEAPDDMNALPE